MTPLLIYNRALALQPDGRIEVLKLGEYEHKETGLIEVVDETALQQVLASFNRDAAAPNFAGILIDQDHFSYDPAKSSEAMGWIQSLERVGDTLVANAEISDLGRAAVEGKRYKFQSPVLERESLGGNRVRPTRLDTLAFTNQPVMKNLAAIALLNRSAEPGAKPTNKGDEMKDKLIPVLGLAADAAESAVIEAVTSLKNRAALVGPLTEERDALKGERDDLLATQIDADLETYQDVIANRDEMKKQLLANRAGTLAILKSLKKPAPPALHNRQGKGTPANPADSAPTQKHADDQHAATLTIKNRDKCTYEQARTIARSEKPELFAEPTAAE